MPGRYQFFHKMDRDRIFHKTNGFTWETNLGRHNVPECYLLPLSLPDGFEGPFTVADACRFRTTGQGGQYHFFQKSTQKCRTCEAERCAGLSEADEATGCDKDHSLALDLARGLGLGFGMIRLRCAAPGTARSIRLSPESEPSIHVYACYNLTSK